MRNHRSYVQQHSPLFSQAITANDPKIAGKIAAQNHIKIASVNQRLRVHARRGGTGI